MSGRERARGGCRDPFGMREDQFPQGRHRLWPNDTLAGPAQECRGMRRRFVTGLFHRLRRTTFLCSAAPPLPLSKVRAAIGRTLARQGDTNLGIANHSDQAPLPLPTPHGKELVAEMQPRCCNSNPEITDLNGQPAPPSADPAEWKGLFGPKEPLPKSTAHDRTPSEPNKPPQPPSMYPNKLQCPLMGANAHPNSPLVHS